MKLLLQLYTVTILAALAVSAAPRDAEQDPQAEDSNTIGQTPSQDGHASPVSPVGPVETSTDQPDTSDPNPMQHGGPSQFPCQCTCTGLTGTVPGFPGNQQGPGGFGQPWQGGFTPPVFPNHPAVWPQQQWQQPHPFGQSFPVIQGASNFGQPNWPNIQGGFGQRPQQQAMGSVWREKKQEEDKVKKTN